MRALCNELRSAYQVLDNIDALCELDTQVVIFSIVAYLPAWVQNRWDKNKLKKKRSIGCYVRFADICKCIEVISDEMGDPLCSSVSANSVCRHINMLLVMLH